MTDPAKPPALSAARGWVLRALFLVAVTAAGAWSLRGRWGEVLVAGADVGVEGWVAALLATLLGLGITGLLWRGLLALHGHRLGVRTATSTFFVGQLGKYVPGSVWSIALQARMAARVGVPVRATASTSLLFLLVHVLSAGPVVLVALPFLSLAPEHRLGVALVALCGLAMFVPPVLSTIVRLTSAEPIGWTARTSLLVLASMCGAWGCYGIAMWALWGGPSASTALVLLAAFAAAYVAGVAVPLAPAGLGAREVVFVLLAAPVTDIVTATAVALLARVVHTGADFLWAVVSWSLARFGDRSAL